MKGKKFLALLLAVTMTFSMVACGDANANNSETGSEGTGTENNAGLITGDVSIDFEDGLYGFVGVDKTVNPSGDDSVIELADYNGSKAIKVTPQGKNPYIKIQVDALLGDKIADLKTVEIVLGTENPDGKFYSASGNVYAFVGESNAKTSSAWSVYLENANPKVISYTLADGSAFVAGNYIVVSMETDTGKDKGATATNFYIDNIVLKDASGNVLTVDTSAQCEAEATGEDRSNLCGLSGAVEFAGFATSGDGWGQNGFEMPEEIVAALVPGSVIEISYSSENGDLWIVLPWATIDGVAAWTRIGDGNNDSAYINNSKNIAQVTYEQIAAVLGEDTSTWGAMLQCEASGAWEVYSVKVGQKAANITLGGAVEFAGFATSGDGWGQNGFEMPEEIVAALVPGSVIEVQYSSENGDLWIVLPWATIDGVAAWTRIGDGNNGQAVCDGSTCYVTYEQIAAVLGEDTATWGAMLQCEASGAWEVYSVKVGTLVELPMVNKLVSFEGFATSGDGWGQNGFEMPEEIVAALVPGAVIEIQYSSENGDLWIVLPDATIDGVGAWTRIGDGNNGKALCDGSTCYVTYEQIAAVLGEDTSTWGGRLQCEASGAWEVYSVSVGQSN